MSSCQLTMVNSELITVATPIHGCNADTLALLLSVSLSVLFIERMHDKMVVHKIRTKIFTTQLFFASHLRDVQLPTWKKVDCRLLFCNFDL